MLTNHNLIYYNITYSDQFIANKMNPKQHSKKGKPHKPFNEPDYYTAVLKGFLVTADQHREKNAVKDAYNVLNKVCIVGFL